MCKNAINQLNNDKIHIKIMRNFIFDTSFVYVGFRKRKSDTRITIYEKVS